MRVIVAIKQVPDTTNVKIDPRKGTLVREGVPSIINPEDKNALELALALKESCGAEVYVISMGPPQAEEALREAIAMGADHAVLLTDAAFAGADTLATSYTLGLAVRKLEPVDMVLCGRQAIDGDTAQVGPQLAEFLDIPQVTYVRKLEVKEDAVEVERELEDGYEILSVRLPALFTVTKDANKPRYPPAAAIMNCYARGDLATWAAADLGVEPDKVGLQGSPTQVRRVFTPESKRAGEIISGSRQEVVNLLCRRLRSKNLV